VNITVVLSLVKMLKEKLTVQVTVWLIVIVHSTSKNVMVLGHVLISKESLLIP
jgi:hypothetical protein